NSRFTDFVHPVLFLPLLVIIVIPFQASIAYIPIAWDEMTHWLAWGKHYFYLDTSNHPALAEYYKIFNGYTKGAGLLAAFAQMPFTLFDPVRGVGILFLLHVAVMGLAWDVIDRILRHHLATPRRAAFVLSWLVVLGLLAIEALWKLVPPSLLIERPLLYPIAALFGAGLLSLYPGEDRLRLAGLMGILLAAAYAFKVSALVAALPAGIMLIAPFCSAYKARQKSTAAPSIDWRRFLLTGALILGPIVFMMIAWRLASGSSVHCMTSPLKSLIAGLQNGTFFTAFETIAPQVLSGAGSYLLNYKIPATLAACSGFGLSLLCRRLWIPMAALLVFFCVYLLIMAFVYSLCGSGCWQDPVCSLQRFLRLPLRTFHYLGIILLPLAGMDLLRRFSPGKIESLTRSKLFFVASGMLIVALAGYQIRAIATSFDHMTTRSNETENFRNDAIRYARETKALIRFIEAENLSSPTVRIVLQGSEGYGHAVARYHSITDRPQPPLRAFHLIWGHSWGAESKNTWMNKTTANKAANALREARIVWPGITDDWILPVLEKLTGKPCPGPYTDYFLIRGDDSQSLYRCEPKERWIKRP
ncbi:MAG: hypothetical protein WD005_06170, partial [Haliea sp.]